MFGRLGRTLDSKDDGFDEQRARLRTALIEFRNRVGQLISLIPRDMPGFTIHDLTHLDALWEMADILTGPDYELNPAEAFVLGGAILLHDAGMTVAAYVGGRVEIERTVEYSTALASIRSQLKTERLVQSVLDERARSAAITETLRALHAQKAEQLATQEWRSPADQSSIFLISDDDLRTHYGQLIGRIAHSHHWDQSRLQHEFIAPLGAAPFLPSAWTVDPLKIALVLRCADACHLDARRAPRLLFAIGRPAGISAQHWCFQALLAKPLVTEGKLLYTSTSDFTVDKAEAWQLAYDTLRMVDNELRSASELNLQKRYKKFAADGVLGAGAPEQLALYVKAAGWKPVSLNLRVSNVPHLARTLGGKDLYSFRLAPLRELIQNAADSIEARVAVDADFPLENGKIQVQVSEDGENGILVEVKDNGVGMSDRVLTGPLLDFGFSFWKSSDARREFPTLQSDRLSPRGRYGIGFFSVFMWAEEVEVISRVYSTSTNETHILHFNSGLDARPILRIAGHLETSTAWSTRVRLRIPREYAGNLLRDVSPAHQRMLPRRYRAEGHSLNFSSWLEAVKLIAGTLPITVEVKTDEGLSIASMPNWKTDEPAKVVAFFREVAFSPSDPVYERFKLCLTDCTSDGKILGRVYVEPSSSEYDRSFVAVYDKGIYAGYSSTASIGGIVEGQVNNAARERFVVPALEQIATWIDESGQRAFAACLNEGEQLAVQRSLLHMGKPALARPMFIRNRITVSWSALEEQCLTSQRIFFRLSEVEDNEFALREVNSLTPIYGFKVDPDRIYPLLDIPGKINRSVEIKSFMKRDDSMLAVLCRMIENAFGDDAFVRQRVYDVDGYRQDYMIIEFTRS